jgi:hypothetical protein
MAQNAVDGLKQVGWSELEARLYVAIHESPEPLTGYQCAKLASAPRPNAYPALQRLVRRGAVLEIPEGSLTRYRAVSFADLKQSLLANIETVLDEADRDLEARPERPQLALAHGDGALVQQGRALIESARQTLDIGASAGTVQILQPALQACHARGVQVTYYCFDGCPAPGCGVCVNPIPVRPGPFEVHGWLTLLADRRTVLMATGVHHTPDLLIADLPPLTETVTTLFSRVARDVRPEAEAAKSCADKSAEDRVNALPS